VTRPRAAHGRGRRTTITEQVAPRTTLLGDRADEQVRDRIDAVAADDDQVDAELASQPQDLVGGLADDRRARAARPAGRAPRR
jgi:hypothetical protein